MNNPYKIMKFDKYTGRIEMPSLLLMNRSFHTIGKIGRYENWNISLVANGMDEISFEVHKYTDGNLCPVWDDLTDLKIVNVKDIGYFEISVDYTDNSETVKAVHGVSLETELAQIRLYEFHVNDDEDTDTEYSQDNYDAEGSFIPTTFYRQPDPFDSPDDSEFKRKHSLLHRVLADKAPHWSIGKVPDSIILDEESRPESSSAFQRTYTVDGDSIYDFLTGTVARESNVVFSFDVEARIEEDGSTVYQRVINCYNLCDYTDPETGAVSGSPIGEDTSVFVSKQKLANEITISSNKDNVKNCFRIEGGDDVITDMVRAVNMNGSNYIYQFADFQYKDMSEKLENAIIKYQQKMSSKEKQDEYYGYGDIDKFLGGGMTLEIGSELTAASILNICGNNKVETGDITIHDYDSDSARYWYITVTDGKKKLHASKTVMRYPRKMADAAIDSMGIYPRLCNAYDELAYFESSMMPNTDQITEVGKAEEQYQEIFQKLNAPDGLAVAVSSMDHYSNDLFAGVTKNIEAYAQIFLDSRFDLEVVSGTASYSYVKGAETGTWKGKIRITQHTNEKNVYPIDISEASELEITVNADETEFAKQKIEKALSKCSMLDIDFDIAEMDNKEIREYFEQFSLNRLKSFYDGYDSCISILMQLDENSKVRQDLYDKYINIMTIISNKPTADDINAGNPNAAPGVLEKRQEQVDTINNKITDIINQQTEFTKKWKLDNFLNKIDKDLYKEFCAYCREDTYSNSNYISDGLTTSECLAKAKELVEAATKEAKKACVLQRTVSTSLNNLFALPEFEPLYDKFALYNYIRIRTEDEILKLRLIGIDFSGDSPEDISVTFSEQIESIDGKMSDLQSIIQQAGSMAASYPSTVLQAKQGSEARNTVLEMYSHGINAARTMLTNNDSNEVTVTPSGIICRRMDDEGFYGDKQLRITGNIMAFTTDNWKTVEMAIGETTFKDPTDPEGKRETTEYGILAPVIVGKLTVSEKMYIGNAGGTVEITGDGIKITNGLIQSANYKKGETGSMLDLKEGIFDYAGGDLKYEDGKLFVNGEISSKSGEIGGWTINGNILSSSGDGGTIQLDSENNSISSESDKYRITLSNGCLFSTDDKYAAYLNSARLIFKKDDISYALFRTTKWKGTEIIGVGINSYADSKFISFGNKNDNAQDSFITPLVLNYGLDPNEDKQDVLIYGTTLFTEETTIRNKLLFGNGNAYLWCPNENNLYCGGKFGINGMPNNNYALTVNGDTQIEGNLDVNGNLSIKGHSLSKIIKETTVDQAILAESAEEAEEADYVWTSEYTKRDPIGTTQTNNEKISVIACRIKDGKSQIGIRGCWSGDDYVLKWFTLTS